MASATGWARSETSDHWRDSRRRSDELTEYPDIPAADAPEYDPVACVVAELEFERDPDPLDAWGSVAVEPPTESPEVLAALGPVLAPVPDVLPPASFPDGRGAAPPAL